MCPSGGQRTGFGRTCWAADLVQGIDTLFLCMESTIFFGPCKFKYKNNNNKRIVGQAPSFDIPISSCKVVLHTVHVLLVDDLITWNLAYRRVYVNDAKLKSHLIR